jgi:hypothetical protein
MRLRRDLPTPPTRHCEGITQAGDRNSEKKGEIGNPCRPVRQIYQIGGVRDSLLAAQDHGNAFLGNVEMDMQGIECEKGTECMGLWRAFRHDGSRRSKRRHVLPRTGRSATETRYLDAFHTPRAAWKNRIEDLHGAVHRCCATSAAHFPVRTLGATPISPDTAPRGLSTGSRRERREKTPLGGR